MALAIGAWSSLFLVSNRRGIRDLKSNSEPLASIASPILNQHKSFTDDFRPGLRVSFFWIWILRRQSENCLLIPHEVH
ncbi:hypothetical protein BJX70DRAFT_371520 [Aspergillus crustosus]